MIILIVMVAWLFTGVAHAACSGSGALYACDAGSTAAEINAAIGAVDAQGEVRLLNGVYGTSGIKFGNMKNGLTVRCESEGGCNMTAASNVFTVEPSGCPASDVTNLFRITGFNFTGQGGGTARIFLYCNVNITALRIDHNEFVDTGVIGINVGAISPISTGKIHGVIDHNYFHGTNNFLAIKNIAGTAGDVWLTGQQGTGNALYIEDNRFEFTNFPNTGSGALDAWRSVNTVFRFNTLVNTRIVNHSYCHANGPYSVEIYGNDIQNAAYPGAPDFRNIHMQGSGEITIWGNKVANNNGTRTNAIEVQSFRSYSGTATTEGTCNSLADGTVTGDGLTPATANDGNRTPIETYRGYPTWHQPGRDLNATLKPIYVWENRNIAGNLVPLWHEPTAGYYPLHLQADRDYYNEAAIFDGTSGTGVGPLASRPATCTPTSEALDAGNGGVGYAADDQGTWKLAVPPYGVNVANFKLYRCSSTNTWTVHYTPYTYPHPLQGVATGTGAGLGGSKGLGLF